MPSRKIIFITAGILLSAAVMLCIKFTGSPEYIIMTGNSFEKRQVIKFLHKKPRWRTVRMLKTLLKDDQAEVRLLAAGCAGEYGYNELTEQLAEMSESDTDSKVRAQSLYRAVQLHAEQSAAIIRKGLAQDNTDIITAALASIPLLEPSDPSLCIPLLKSPDSRIRDKALEVAVTIKAQQAVPVLARDLESEELFGLPELLDALQYITGVNHGTDTEAWLRWYTEQSSSDQLPVTSR